MANVLGGLDPQPVWRHFEALCAIPRPSRREERAARHVLALARSWGLEAKLDTIGNVIVKKPATPGMEGRRTVVLQCHLDMVSQKAEGSTHDFAADPILPRIDGAVVRATGTTLGADDGIGVSVALAVLEAKDLVHGPLEALFTIDEETGMTGANKLQAGLLSGDILLNLDSEDEGELCIGCAGGIDVKATLAWREEATPAGRQALRVAVAGLKGGHSGVDIQLGRANANKLLTRLLYDASRAVDVRLVSMAGGDLRNAIPRAASAVITVPARSAADAERVLRATFVDAQREVRLADPDVRLAMETSRAPKRGMSRALTAKVLRALTAAPHGVFAMVRDMPNVTETSTNLAIIQIGRGRLSVISMVRSSVDSKKKDVEGILRAAFELIGCEVVASGAYPGWTPDTTSPVLAMLKRVYDARFHKPAKVVATHGGLECGIIRSVYPHMDAVSIGPTVRFPHSPDEHVDVASVRRFWDFLVYALKDVPAR